MEKLGGSSDIFTFFDMALLSLRSQSQQGRLSQSQGCKAFQRHLQDLQRRGTSGGRVSEQATGQVQGRFPQWLRTAYLS